ncbi:LSM domain-containing protein [Bacteroidota bacterium]
MEASRPLDALNKARNSKVIVELKNGKKFVGKLIAFDIHINTVLDDCEEYEGDTLKRKIGTVFIRGDTITIIAPK